MAWKELAFTDEVILNSDISEAEGFLRKTGAGTYEAIKTNMNASVAPTANEDSGDGYAVGSRWIDTTHDKEYICLDASVGSAVWTETTGSGGASDHGALTGLADDDHTQYLLADGTRAMTDNLDMGGNDVTLDNLVPSGTTKYIGSGTDRFAIGFFDEGHFYTKVSMHGTKIELLADPTADQDAATKKFVDDHNWAVADITSGILAVARGGTGVSGDTYDADKVDGKHATDFLLLDGTQAMAADLNFNKKNADAMCIQPLASAPATPGMAQMYYNTTDDHLYVYAS